MSPPKTEPHNVGVVRRQMTLKFTPKRCPVRTNAVLAAMSDNQSISSKEYLTVEQLRPSPDVNFLA